MTPLLLHLARLSCGMGRNRHLITYVCGTVLLKLNYLTHNKKKKFETISCHFIRYPDKFKGYRLYYPGHFIEFIETGQVMFLEDQTWELTKKGVPSAVGFPHCAGSGEGLFLRPKPYPHKCAEAGARTRDLPVTMQYESYIIVRIY